MGHSGILGYLYREMITPKELQTHLLICCWQHLKPHLSNFEIRTIGLELHAAGRPAGLSASNVQLLNSMHAPPAPPASLTSADYTSACSSF